MAEMKKWHTAFLAGVILIIPVIFVYQLYIQPDIEIKFDPSFANGCNMEGTVCTYNMDSTSMVIVFTEDEDNWKLTGNCVDMVIDQHKRMKAIQTRDGGFTTLEFPADPERCLDFVVFKKINWLRENTIIQGEVDVQCITTPCPPVKQDFEVNTFRLIDVAMNQDVSNFIEKSYGG